MVFGPMPAAKEVATIASIIGNNGSATFELFMDDHMGAFSTFDDQQEFLYQSYFPRVAFGPTYQAGPKTCAITDTIEMIGFTGTAMD
ncbi:MAG: hypothetical protein M1819_003821 [Sarea resinae]|nr:MAG: hypothetical protein M1819_003821 [Sarea resinae]